MKLRYLFICTLIAGVLSCSGGTGIQPISPPVSPDNHHGNLSAGRVLFGAWILDVSADHSSVNPVPLRTGAGHFNIRTFLENAPCTDCLKITSVTDMGGGVLNVDIRINHPFVGIDKFTGFDVRGTVIFPSSDHWPSNDLSWSNPDNGLCGLVNPDGWTTLFNPVDFAQAMGDPDILTYQQGKFATVLDNASKLNGYKAFYIEPDRRPFFTDDSITRTFSLRLPDGPFQFGYVVDASWAKPDPNPPVSVPGDFPIEANSAEAYKISAHVGEGFNVSGGIATCEIDVYDWQGTSTISSVTIECPDLFDGIMEAGLDTDFGTISRWSVLVNNMLLPDEGDYPLLIRADDVNDDPLLGPVAAYSIIQAHVGPAPPPPDDIYVDRDYPGLAGGLPEAGTQEEPFTTINSAVLVAPPGVKIHIDPSPDPYDEQVYLKSDRYLLGDNWRDDGDSGQPVIEASEFGISIYGVAVSDTIIDNLEIRPGGDLMEDFLYGIYLGYYSPTEHVENVTIRNCTFTGDRVHTGNNTGDEVICCEVKLTDNFIFEDNLITDVHVGSDQGGYFGGLHVDVCDGVIIRRNTITECTFRNSYLGMHVWYSDLPVLIEDNELSWLNNSDTPTGFTIGWGINVIGYSDVTVRHNKIHDIGGPGHRLETIGMFFRVSGAGTYYNWNIENNLIYNLYAQDADNTYNSADCRGIMFRMNSWDPPNHLDGLRIANNTVVGLTSGEYVVGMKFDLGSNNMLYNYEIENNIFADITGPATPDSWETSSAIYAYWPGDDLFIDYTLFNNVVIPDPMFYGVDLGPGVILGEDPMFLPDWHLPIDSPAQLGNPNYLDYDDPGPASGDPGNLDPDTRSRMGAYGGPGGDW